MKKAYCTSAALLCLLSVAGVLSGCNNTSSGAVTKSEEQQFRAPAGQPMPAQARAEMEKMRQKAATNAPVNNAPAPAATP